MAVFKPHPLFRLGRAFAAVAALFAVLVGCTELTGTKPSFRSIDLTGAPYAQGFAAPDAQGAVRKLQDFSGKVVVVFFGFTQCPDVCPTTLLELAEAKKLLPKLTGKANAAAHVQGVFITLDPERDTPEVLDAYVKNFDPTTVALRPSPEQLTALAQDFKIFYKKSYPQGSENKAKAAPIGSPSPYSIDHTAASFVFDKNNKIRLYVRYQLGSQALAEDLAVLLK